MSELSTAPYSPFRRIKITQQHISVDVSAAQIVSGHGFKVIAAK